MMLNAKNSGDLWKISVEKGTPGGQAQLVAGRAASTFCSPHNHFWRFASPDGLLVLIALAQSSTD